jgi:hypothetical protein
MSLPGDDNPNPQWRKREPPMWSPQGQQPPAPPLGDQQPVWQEQPRPPQFQPSPPTSGLAIASLILSISAFVALPLVGSLAGVVCGHMARSKLRQSGYASEGNGLALAGVIIGWVGIAFYVGLIALIVIGLSV